MSIKLVSEMPEEQVAERRAREEAKRAEREVENARARAVAALVRLTGNLLRIARGSGKPYEVFTQAHEYLEAERALPS